MTARHLLPRAFVRRAFYLGLFDLPTAGTTVRVPWLHSTRQHPSHRVSTGLTPTTPFADAITRSIPLPTPPARDAVATHAYRAVVHSTTRYPTPHRLPFSRL